MSVGIRPVPTDWVALGREAVPTGHPEDPTALAGGCPTPGMSPSPADTEQAHACERSCAGSHPAEAHARSKGFVCGRWRVTGAISCHVPSICFSGAQVQRAELKGGHKGPSHPPTLGPRLDAELSSLVLRTSCAGGHSVNHGHPLLPPKLAQWARRGCGAPPGSRPLCGDTALLRARPAAVAVARSREQAGVRGSPPHTAGLG